MACNALIENHCDACFNWSTGYYTARFLKGGECKDKIIGSQVNGTTLEVASCLYYSGTNNGTEQTIDNCLRCNKSWLNYNENTKKASCNNNAFTSSDNENFREGIPIENCEQNVRVIGDKTNSKALFVDACRQCKKNYSGKKGTFAKVGYKECREGSDIANCQFVMSDTREQTCYGCGCGYTVAYDQKSCVSMSFEHFCRV